MTRPKNAQKWLPKCARLHTVSSYRFMLARTSLPNACVKMRKTVQNAHNFRMVWSYCTQQRPQRVTEKTQQQPWGSASFYGMALATRLLRIVFVSSPRRNRRKNIFSSSIMELQVPSNTVFFEVIAIPNRVLSRSVHTMYVFICINIKYYYSCR